VRRKQIWWKVHARATAADTRDYQTQFLYPLSDGKQTSQFGTRRCQRRAVFRNKRIASF